MESRQKKDALFEAIAVMGKAFASPVRLELLDLLGQAPRSVDELARLSNQSIANTSQHLQALHAAGLVARAREGTRVRYALAREEAMQAASCGVNEEERDARDRLPLRAPPRSSGRRGAVPARPRAQRARPSRDGAQRRPDPRTHRCGRVRRPILHPGLMSCYRQQA